MNSKYAVGAAVALMLGAGVLASPVQAEQQYLVILDTPDGMVQRVLAESELDVTLTCSVDAPSAPSCQNGPIVRVFGASHGIALPIPSGFTSPAGNVPFHQVRVLSILTSTTTERVFHCTIWQANGPVTFGCGTPASTGSFPPIGAAMTQTAVGIFTPAHAANSPLLGDQTTEQLYFDADILVPGFGKFNAVLTA